MCPEEGGVGLELGKAGVRSGNGVGSSGGSPEQDAPDRAGHLIVTSKSHRLWLRVRVLEAVAVLGNKFRATADCMGRYGLPVHRRGLLPVVEVTG